MVCSVLMAIQYLSYLNAVIYNMDWRISPPEATAFLKTGKWRVRNMATSSSVESSSLDISQLVYTPNYCEENVYFLCKKLCSNGIADAAGTDLFVVFISNEKKQIPLWNQKASGRADGIVLWDYHVICIQRKSEGDPLHLVWDLDSTLPLPSPLATYVSETIRPSFPLFSDFQRVFRVVHAPIFSQHFASDRRHMKDFDGNWIAEPPAYDPIVAKDGTVHNLNEYMEIQMAEMVSTNETDLETAVFTQKCGVVIGESGLVEFFSKIP